MKKRFLCLLVVLTMLFAVNVYAASPRTASAVPSITFDGTEATCTATIIGDLGTDKIVATMKLKQGSTVIDTWTDSGYGFLKLEGTADVVKNKTYTLVVDVSINGVSQPSATITRTNS